MNNIHELISMRDVLLQQIEALNALIDNNEQTALWVRVQGCEDPVPVLEIIEIPYEDQLEIAQEWFGDEIAESEIQDSEIVRIRLPDGTWDNQFRQDLFSK